MLFILMFQLQKSKNKNTKVTSLIQERKSYPYLEVPVYIIPDLLEETGDMKILKTSSSCATQELIQ